MTRWHISSISGEKETFNWWWWSPGPAWSRSLGRLDWAPYLKWEMKNKKYLKWKISEMRNKQALVSRIALQPIWDPHITRVPFLPPWKRSTSLTDKIKERERTKVERMGLWCHRAKDIWETDNTFLRPLLPPSPPRLLDWLPPTLRIRLFPKSVLCRQSDRSKSGRRV